MDYNGDRNETEIKGEIQTFVAFANTIYWQQLNTTVINVVNGETKEICRNISLISQWTNLTSLVVVDTFHQPIGEKLFIPITILTSSGSLYNTCKHASSKKATQFLFNFLSIRWMSVVSVWC